MGKPGGVAIGAALASLSLTAAPGASAATEVGSNCQAIYAIGDNTIVQLAKAPGSPLPVTVLTPGIATKWKIDSGLESTASDRLEVLRPTGTPNTFQLIAEANATVVPGPNAFDVKIPVQAGDHFGLYGASRGAAYCPTSSGADVMGIFGSGSPFPLGSTTTFNESTKFQAAVSVIVEPDADGDGYGDETQDSCPQSAQIHEACPPLTLSLYSIAQRSSALVLVSASVPSKITVSARVPGAPPKKKRAGTSATIKLKPVTHLANPGQITKYKLKFPGPLRAALKALPKSKTLALKVRAEGANLAGVVRFEERTLRLKGQG